MFSSHPFLGLRAAFVRNEGAHTNHLGREGFFTTLIDDACGKALTNNFAV
jgi:hypothetical protein